jgi:hypothetical protein
VFGRVPLHTVTKSLKSRHVEPIRGFSVIWTAPDAPWDELCEHLPGFAHLTRLETLWLGCFTDRGAAALARAPFLPQLRELSIERATLSAGAGLALAARLDPARVRRLSVPRTIGESALDELRARFGANVVENR